MLQCLTGRGVAARQLVSPAANLFAAFGAHGPLHGAAALADGVQATVGAPAKWISTHHLRPAIEQHGAARLRK